MIKHWASTQKTLALSSGEAELVGILEGTSEALGLQSLAQDLGLEMDIEVRADAAAAVGIFRRTGIGKDRHLAVGQLWVQEKLRVGGFKLFKHPGEANPGDLLTKHVTGLEVEGPATRSNLAGKGGRAECAPGTEWGVSPEGN